jgi:hypothetical protein
VCVSATNKYGGDSAPRTSFFLFLKERDVIVKKWNPKTEELEDETDKEQIEAYVNGSRKSLSLFFSRNPPIFVINYICVHSNSLKLFWDMQYVFGVYYFCA